MRRKPSSVRGSGVGQCTESIKYQKENAPNIILATNLNIGGGGGKHTLAPSNLFIEGGGHAPPPAPFSYATVRDVRESVSP